MNSFLSSPIPPTLNQHPSLSKEVETPSSHTYLIKIKTIYENSLQEIISHWTTKEEKIGELSNWILDLKSEYKKEKVLSPLIRTFLLENDSPSEFIQKWVEEIRPLLSHSTPHQLVNTALGLSKMQLILPSDFWEEWIMRAQELLPHFTPRHLITCLYSFGKLGLSSNRDFIYSLQEKLSPHFSILNSSDLSRMIYGFSKLNFRPDPLVLNNLKRHMDIHSKKITSQDLIHMMSAFAHLKIEPPCLVWKEWKIFLTKNLANLNAQELTNTIYIFSRLDITPSKTLSTQLLIYATEKLDYFLPFELVLILYSLGQLGLQPDHHFLMKWENCILKCFARLNSQNLSDCLYAYTQLDLTPSSPYLSQWTTHSCQKIKEFTPTELIYCFYSLALFLRKEEVHLHSLYYPLIWAFREEVERCEPLGLDKEETHLLYLAYLSVQPLISFKNSSFWNNLSQTLPPVPQKKFSNFENKIISQLNQIPLCSVTSVSIPSLNLLGTSLVLQISLLPERKIALFLDNQTSYYPYTHSLHSFKKLNSLLLEEKGYYPLHLPSYELKKGKLQTYLVQKIAECNSFWLGAQTSKESFLYSQDS